MNFFRFFPSHLKSTCNPSSGIMHVRHVSVAVTHMTFLYMNIGNFRICVSRCVHREGFGVYVLFWKSRDCPPPPPPLTPLPLRPPLCATGTKLLAWQKQVVTHPCADQGLHGLMLGCNTEGFPARPQLPLWLWYMASLSSKPLTAVIFYLK